MCPQRVLGVDLPAMGEWPGEISGLDPILD